MNDRMSDFSTHEEDEARYGSSNLGLGLTLLFIGLAAGALTALLLAPKTGKQMRRTLRRKYEDAREAMEDLQDHAGDWMDRGSDLADKAKRRVGPLADRFRR